MKTLPALMLLLALGASQPASAISLMLDFGNPAPNTGSPQTTSTSPGPVATGSYLTLSPGHATGSVAATETTWNTITASTPRSDLKFSDGSDAATVILTLGQEAVSGDNIIDYGTAISNLALVGSGGATSNRQSLLTPGSIYGDSRLGSSAVGRDGFFGASGVSNGPGAAIGFRVDGLAAGDYTVYLMGRNTNSNAAAAGSMTLFWDAGPPSGTFAFSSANAEFQANTTYASTGYTGQYASFAAGENYVAFDVTITAGQSLFVAVDGGSVERGFLNMAQITPATVTPASLAWSKGDGDWDTTSFNWNADSEVYSEPALVTFSTLFDGVDGINTVNLTAEFSPSTVNITNTGDFDTTAYTFTGPGSISGSTGITKSGSGIARFSNASNSYSGILTISAGAVIKEVADDTTGDISVTGGATFALAGGVTDGSGQTLTISGTGSPNLSAYFYPTSLNQRGALQGQQGDNTWAGNIVLTGTAGTSGTTRIGVQNGASLTLTGAISEAVAGMSPFFRAGDSASDVITLAGTCSWTGPTRIYSNGGIVTISADNTLPAAVDLVVGAAAGASGSPTFDLAGFDQTVAGLSGVIDTGGLHAPIIKNSGGDQSILTLNPGAATSFPGIIQDQVKLVIGGTEVQTLAGDNTYAGDTIINAGATLIIGDGGELQFYPAANGITNSVSGTGVLQYDGILRVDVSGADATPGNSWVLVNAGSLATTTFGDTFAVTGSSGDFAQTAVDSGIWKKVDGGIEWTFTESTGTLSVAASAAQPFDAWISLYFPGVTDPAVVGKGADPDGDGADNLAEFALNGNPDDGADNGYDMVALEDSDGDMQKELTITIAVRKAGGSPVFAGSPLTAVSDGVKYTIEGSLDLVFPTSAASEASPAAGPDGLPSDYEYRRFRLDASEGLTGKGFLRVKTEPAP